MNDLWAEYLDFQSLKQVFLDNGCRRVYVKQLAPNDNSKNQIFVGNDLTAVSALPIGELQVVAGTSRKQKSSGSIVRASLNLVWLSSHNQQKAPDAKLILYPQYPEVRLSGFLRGVSHAPSELLDPHKRGREPGRILLLGLNDNSQTLYALLLSADAAATVAVRSVLGSLRDGIFQIWNLENSYANNSKDALLDELRRINNLGWIDGQRLSHEGLIPYRAQNGGGYTLEAELGIFPNGFSSPDFLGWEVKQHAVGNFSKPRGGSITLLTPEPDAGVYISEGLEIFLQTWGKVRTGTSRMDFAGQHKFNVRSKRTGLLLLVDGYSPGSKTFDAAGGLTLVDSKQTIAASWSFEKLLQHWKRKHSNAVYVPSISRVIERSPQPIRQYMYGHEVHLGMETSFSKFLDAIISRELFYDPGVHLTPGVETKKRNQFRINSRNMKRLYEYFSAVDLRE